MLANLYGFYPQPPLSKRDVAGRKRRGWLWVSKSHGHSIVHIPSRLSHKGSKPPEFYQKNVNLKMRILCPMDLTFGRRLPLSINCPLPYSYAPYSAFQQLGKNELRDRPWTQREGSQFQVESSQFQAILRINRTQRLPILPSLRPKSNPTWARNNPPFPLFFGLFVSFIWERWHGSFQPRLNPSVHSKWKTAILRFSMNIIIQVTKGQPVKSQLIRQDNGSLVSRRLRRSVLLTERMKNNGKANKV